jgi:general secretion pathway protein M
MKAKLEEMWKSRTPRERSVITGLVIILILASYGWFVTSAHQVRARLHSSMATLRAQAAQLRQDVSEYERLRAAPPAPITPVDLRILIKSQADALGVSRSLVEPEMEGSDQIRVVLNSLPFADWLSLVAAMQMQRVRLENSRIQALPEPGMVSVTATFNRSTPP